MTTVIDEIDIGRLRGWIGNELVSEELLTPPLAERFHATLELPGRAPKEGDRAPRLIHFCLCQPAARNTALGTDGHVARGVFLPPVPLPRRMWAAGDLRFVGDLRVGQMVRRTSRVSDVVLKTGKSGHLVFVTIDHRIEADGALRIEEVQTVVYREAGGPNKMAVGEPAPSGITRETITPTSALLFRYSALTFNSHRIHYDRAYALEEEGFPGLVVQGPLQATWLLHLAARTAGGVPPDRFIFRGTSPLFDLEDVHLYAGARTKDRRDLWTAREGGAVAMQAEAIWS